MVPFSLHAAAKFSPPGDTDLLKRIEHIRDILLERREYVETQRKILGSSRFKMETRAGLS